MQVRRMVLPKEGTRNYGSNRGTMFQTEDERRMSLEQALREVEYFIAKGEAYIREHVDHLVKVLTPHHEEPAIQEFVSNYQIELATETVES